MQYRVTHENVGRFTRGHVFTEQDLLDHEDIKHWLDVGAVEKVKGKARTRTDAEPAAAVEPAVEPEINPDAFSDSEFGEETLP